MVITAIGGSQSNNLQGIVDGKYQAVIPKNHLTGVNLSEQINKKIRIEIVKINNDRYEVIPLAPF